MQDTIGFSAIGWVHYRLTGGVKQVLIVAGVYAAIIVGILIFAMRVSDQFEKSPGLFYRVVVSALIGLQAVVLILLGSFRVSAAIRLDFTSNMMESHRLMPLHGFHAILGYIIGATTHVWTIGLVNVVITVALAMNGNFSLSDALTAHAVIFEFALFFWVVTTLAAISNRPFLRSVTGIPIMLFLSRTVLEAIFPGIYLFCSPIIGRTVLFFGVDFLSNAMLWSLAGQAAAGSICFIAAAQKYRRPDKPSLYPWQGAGLLATWVVLTLVGTTLGRASASMPASEFGRGAAFLATVALSLLLMIVPLSTAAWFANDARRNRPNLPTALIELRAWGWVLATAFLAIAATRVHRVRAGLFDLTGEDLWALFLITMPLLGHAIAVHFILRIVHRAGGKLGGLLIFLWIFCVTMLPLLADLLFHVATQTATERLGLIGSFSPIGTASMILQPGSPPAQMIEGVVYPPAAQPSAILGAIVQLLLGISLAVIYYATTSRRTGVKPARSLTENRARS